MTPLHALFWAFGIVVFTLGLQGIIYFPLTVVYEVWKRRTLQRLPPFTGRVSAVVPAYNEERTIRVSLETLLESEWPDLEVIVVDDGSTDATAERIRDLADAGRIRLIRQENGGKAKALNAGIQVATGEVVLYTDADSLFLRDTVAKMARWFADPAIDAVCGNDAPLRTGTALQKLLVVTTHIGTGYVRRALSVIRCLPIISGNLGAIRRRVLEEIGGFSPIWGEDLEVTWRLHLHRKRIVFDPEPVVLADCPATLGALWRQRVRWVRSYLKVARMHRALFFRRGALPFSLYLPVNFANMAVVPVLQTALALGLPAAVSQGWLRIDGPVELAAWLGLSFFFAVAIYGILLDRDLPDLVYVPWGLLILPVSYFLNAVVLYSWWKEMRRAEEKWEKVRRLGPAPEPASRRWAFTLSLLGVALAASAATWTVMAQRRLAGPPAPPVHAGAGVARPAFKLALSTHFDAYGDWRDAVKRVDERLLFGLGDTVGIGAGRPEWAHFRWEGHGDRWSEHQKGEPKEDMLRVAAKALRAKGHHVAAIVDLYAPKWIETHPGSGAVRDDGTVHREQVCLADLADGQYGKLVLEMVEYLAAHYPVDAIDVTEAAYKDTSFGPRDLLSYRAQTGRADWPRNWMGRPNRDDPSVWEWKAAVMERFVARVADAAHRHRKKLYLDVAASWKDLSLRGRDYGHDYERMLRHADVLVVWNYYALELQPPEASRDLARSLAGLPADRVWVSLGLWGRDGKILGPAEIDAAIAAMLDGGQRQIWVTPNDLLSDAHWNVILRRWLVASPRMSSAHTAPRTVRAPPEGQEPKGGPPSWSAAPPASRGR